MFHSPWPLMLLVLASCAASGCLGFGTMGHREWTRTYVEGDFILGPRPHVSCMNGLVRSSHALTRYRILAEWGEPDSVGNDRDVETWYYRGERYWSGLWLFLGVPIPLFVPTGVYQTTFEFRGDELATIHGVDLVDGAAAVVGFGIGRAYGTAYVPGYIWTFGREPWYGCLAPEPR